VYHYNSRRSQYNPFLKAKEAVRLASTEKDDEAAGGFGSLPEEPRIYLFEEDEELSWGARCDKVNLTDEVIAVVDERSSRVKGSDAAVFCFSSGTSGLPKAVIITHSNLVSNTIQSSFLLYDRMNEPLIDGRKYSKDGRQGWYDNARKSKAEGGTKDTGKSRSLFNSFKDKISLSKKEDKTGMARIHNRPEGQQEFHIDVLPQFHCYGLLVNLVALHTVSKLHAAPLLQDY
jgi:4-coumarate--CoA ligase